MSECKFYNNGKCEYFAEARHESRIPSRRCCMRIVKPLTECFYYQPKDGKEEEYERQEFYKPNQKGIRQTVPS